MTTSPAEPVTRVTPAEAARALKSGEGPVSINDELVLQVTGSQLVCDVVVAANSAWRCQHEFEVLVENARLALQSSPLYSALPDLPQLWRVVDLQGGTVAVLWMDEHPG